MARTYMEFCTFCLKENVKLYRHHWYEPHQFTFKGDKLIRFTYDQARACHHCNSLLTADQVWPPGLADLQIQNHILPNFELQQERIAHLCHSIQPYSKERWALVTTAREQYWEHVEQTYPFLLGDKPLKDITYKPHQFLVRTQDDYIDMWRQGRIIDGLYSKWFNDKKRHHVYHYKVG